MTSRRKGGKEEEEEEKEEEVEEGDLEPRSNRKAAPTLSRCLLF